MVKALTWDQGTEMARRDDIENALGIEVYFCEPRSPGQRPTKEQTNGLLQRWLPKGADFDIAPVPPALTEDNSNETLRQQHDRQSAQPICSALNGNHRQSLPIVRMITIGYPHHLPTPRSFRIRPLPSYPEAHMISNDQRKQSERVKLDDV